MFNLVERRPIDPARVQKLRVATSRSVFDLHGGFAHYKAKFDALLSTHYAAAVILHDRQLSLAQFAPARYDDPHIRKFAAERVEVTCDPALSGVQAVVEANMVDGATIAARCDHPRGSPQDPLSREQIEDKFRTYARARLAEPRIEEIISTVSGLERLKSVRSLMENLRPIS
jgi:2-methylcitrate dehydratase PrpD